MIIARARETTGITRAENILTNSKVWTDSGEILIMRWLDSRRKSDESEKYKDINKVR